MENNKLYRVTVEVEYYAWAEDEDEAREFAGDAVSDEPSLSDCAIAFHDTEGNMVSGWKPETLVYHEGKEDISLEDCIAVEALRKESAKYEEPGTPLLDSLMPAHRLGKAAASFGPKRIVTKGTLTRGETKDS